MIKDNHIAEMKRNDESPTFQSMVSGIRQNNSEAQIVLEIDELNQLSEALQSGTDVILLDNFSAEELRLAVLKTKDQPKCHRPLLEASGGVTLDGVKEIAASGVDRISIGALTHAAQSLDLGLDFDESQTDHG